MLPKGWHQLNVSYHEGEEVRPRRGHTATLLSSSPPLVLFYGGVTSEGASGDMALFNVGKLRYFFGWFLLETATWTKMEHASPRRAFHSADLVGTRLYVFGGLGPPRYRSTNSLVYFDIEKCVWFLPTVKTLPEPRSKHCSAVLGEKIFFFCGETPVIDCFDTSKMIVNLIHLFRHKYFCEC